MLVLVQKLENTLIKQYMEPKHMPEVVFHFSGGKDGHFHKSCLDSWLSIWKKRNKLGSKFIPQLKKKSISGTLKYLNVKAKIFNI